MTEQLTSPSNCSIQENLLRFNSSSCCVVSPSQSNLGSHFKQNLIPFEQYKCEKQIVNENRIKKPAFTQAIAVGNIKKKLTIQIDESFSEQNSSGERRYEAEERMDKNKIKQHKDNEKQALIFEQSSRQIGCLQLISPIQNKINTKSFQLQGIIKELERKNQGLENNLCQVVERAKQYEEKIKALSYELQKRRQESENKSVQIEKVNEKLRAKQAENEKLRHQIQLKTENQISVSMLQQVDDKMKQKDSKIRQLAKINEKLKNLNKALVNQVKVSEKKVRDLQKEIQSNVCITTQENLHRLKQSSLKIKEKENIQRYNISSHQHTKTERDSLHTNHGFKDKQKEGCLAATSNLCLNGGRKSLERKKNGQVNTTSAGQLSQPKKIGSKSGVPTNSNPLLSKKLMHK